MDAMMIFLCGVLLVAGCLQVSQLIEDVLLLYCISREYARTKTPVQQVVAGAVGIAYIFLRCVSLGATFVFKGLCFGDSAERINRLILLNVALYLPARIVTLAAGAAKALKHDSSESKALQGAREGHICTEKLPSTLIIMPCYRESFEMVLSSIRSVAESAYPKDRIHIFLSFDGPQNDAVFHRLVSTTFSTLKQTLPFELSEGQIHGVSLTMCVFKHGGKTRCQANTIDAIKQLHPEYILDAHDVRVLMLDSDTVIHPFALRQLGSQFRAKQSSSSADASTNAVATTCIQGISNPSASFLAAFQESEYFLYSIFFEVVMTAFGNVACLAGPFIYVKLPCLLQVWDDFVEQSSRDNRTAHEHWTHCYGEDRYLTQRLGEKFGVGSTGMFTGTVSETAAAPTMRSLLVQRRRWFLGAIATEATYLCGAEFWSSTPSLSLWRMWKPASVSDVQMVLIAILTVYSGLQGYSWLVHAVAVSLLAELAVLCMFRSLRWRVGLLLYPFGRLIFPLVNAVAAFWAVFSLYERQW